MRSIIAPRDTLEMPSLRDGGRREIPWDEPLPDLDQRRRDLLAAAWRWRMEQEHHAVASFSAMTLDLCALGCDPITLSLMARAASDEVRHADICRRVAELHLGHELPIAMTGIRVDRSAKDEDDVVRTIAGMCCLSETMTGVYFTEMLEKAAHPISRAAVQSLLEDEIDHGRVGWAFLAAVRKRGGGKRLGDDLPDLIRVTVKEVIDEAREAPEEEDLIIEAHGYLNRSRAGAMYEEAFFEVLLPGFEALDVDTRPARALAEAEGWKPTRCR